MFNDSRLYPPIVNRAYARRSAARVHAIAYVLLVIAALAKQNAFLGPLNRNAGQQTHEIEVLCRDLARTVQTQDHEIHRLDRLKQFQAPQVAELVVA